MKLKDKVALITGGGQGLGKAIALAMAKEGASIVICDLNPDPLAETTKEIEALGGSCLGVVCDVSSVESVEKMFTQTVERFGTFHILVNNAAMIAKRPADTERRNRLYAAKSGKWVGGSLGITTSLTDEDWLRFWAVNVHGVFYCTRAGAAANGAATLWEDHQHRFNRGPRDGQRLQPALFGYQGGGDLLHQDCGN